METFDFDNDGRPIIRMSGDKLPDIVDAAEEYLIAVNERDCLAIYQRDGRLVKICECRVRDARGRNITLLLFRPLVKENIVETLTEIISWRNVKEMKGGEIKETRIACPNLVAETFLARGEWTVPTIRSIITAPTLRHDGSVLNKPGYDEATGLYFAPQGVKFLDIPEMPSKGEARDMLDCLCDMVRDVPFRDDDEDSGTAGRVSRAVFLSALLSAVVRHMLPAVPLHGFSSPTAGSGKSMLVDAISAILTGEPAPVFSYTSQEETGKALTAALMAGYPIISFDNVEPDEALGGPLICQAITQPNLALRILGKSELVKVTNNALYMATGNNLHYTGDLTRRGVMAVIDPKCEQPENRDFDGKSMRPDLFATTNRSHLIMACLTILRAFIVADKPRQSKPVGSFEVWSLMIRDCLIWLGEADPWVSVQAIRENDPALANNAAALHELYEAFGPEPKFVKDIIDDAKAVSDSMNGSRPKLIRGSLNDALQVVTANTLSSSSLGAWLRAMRDRQVGGYTLQQAGSKNNTVLWRVVKEKHAPNHKTAQTLGIFS